jgi:hypothetical protein
MDVKLEVSFLNDNNDTIFEFFPEPLAIDRPNVDAAGYTTDINYMETPQVYKIQDISNLSEATQLYFKTTFGTRPQPDVVIFTEESKVILQITSRLKITPSKI